MLSAIVGAMSGLAGAGLVAVIGKGLAGSSEASLLVVEFFGLCLLYFLTKSTSEISLLYLTQKTVYRLRIDLSRKILAAPLKKLNALGKPGLQVILTRDIESVIQAFQALPLLFCDGVLLIACMAYLAWLSMPLFLFFFAALGTSAIAYHFAERRPLRLLREVRMQTEILYRNFRSLVEGARELQMNRNRSNFFVDRVIGSGALDLKQAYVRSMSEYTLVLNTGVVFFYAVIGVTVFLMPQWLPKTRENVASMTLVLLYLIRPVSEIMLALPSLRQAGIALNKIGQLEHELDIAAPATAEGDPFFTREPLSLELLGVCHRYPSPSDDRPFMLGPIDLQIGPGEILFIVGGNGSGKTTLAMLLLGLFDPEAGSIRLNGKAVTDQSRESYRQYFSVVFADFHLFEHVPESGQEGVDERAAHYLAALGMGRKATVSGGKFSSIDLSTGQRKRLALVSSYLEDRSVYLFDEWAADQDPAFKQVFYTELLPELKAKGKTVIVISHDDAYFRCADRVVKLTDGRLQSADFPQRSDLDEERRKVSGNAHH